MYTIRYHYMRKNSNQFGKNDRQLSYTNENVIYRSFLQILVQMRACVQQSTCRACALSVLASVLGQLTMQCCK